MIPNREDEAEKAKLAPLELFFDLTYVFAFTQITSLLLDNLAWVGVFQAVAVLAALWWLWTKYTWLMTIIPAERVLSERLVILIAAMGTFILALTIRGAFSNSALLFGATYFSINVVQLALSMAATPTEVRRAVYHIAPGFLAGPALVLLAGFLEPTLQLVLWYVGLAIDFASPVNRVPRAQLHAAHYVERYRHVIVMAQGEVFLAVGFAVSAPQLDPPLHVLLAAALAALLIIAIGWLYFDKLTEVAKERFAAAQGIERDLLARDSYAYLHLPLVAGIILMAAGLEQTAGHPQEPLPTIAAAVMFGGGALYLLGLNAFSLRDQGRFSVLRLFVAGLVLALIPLTGNASALASLGMLSAVFSCLVAVETVQNRTS